MITYALIFATGSFTLGLLLNLWRVIQGPQISDRILALDTLYINAIALLVLLGCLVFLARHDAQKPATGAQESHPG